MKKRACNWCKRYSEVLSS